MSRLGSGVWSRFGGLGRWQLQEVASEDVMVQWVPTLIGWGIHPLIDATSSGGDLNAWCDESAAVDDLPSGICQRYAKHARIGACCYVQRSYTHTGQCVHACQGAPLHMNALFESM